MSTIERFFRDRGLDVDESTLVDALTELLDDRVGAATAAPLTDADRGVLEAHGGVTPSRRASTRAAATTAAAVGELVGRALTVDEVAAQAGVSPSRVRHWIGDGALRSVKVGGRHLLPAWQFGPGGRPLPGLGAVLGALPDDLHPLSVAGFFTTPQPELEVGEQALAPVEWLASGGDPREVVALAEALAVTA